MKKRRNDFIEIVGQITILLGLIGIIMMILKIFGVI